MRLANVLSASGARPGDRVAVVGMNCLELIEAWLATLRLGAVAVPVNFRLVADEIAYVLADSGSVAVIADLACAPIVARARTNAPSVHTVFTIGDGLDEVIAAADGVRLNVTVADEAPAFIMYTSGTTGFPKGAVITHRNLYLHAVSVIATLGLREGDNCWMAHAPLFHVAGVSGMFPTFLTGGTVVVPPSGHFDPEATMRLIVDERVTSCWMTPAQWQLVCALPGLRSWNLSQLRRVWWGAAPASTTLLRAMFDAFPGTEVIAAFGQTECSPITCLLSGEDAIRKIGSVGTPMLNVEVRIVDDEMNDVGQGEVDEIVYLGPLVMKGYWNRPIETGEAFHGGWFHSGDLVRQDGDGYIYVVDRKKDMIISGGENIYSAEVENVVAAHAKVAEVAVIGVPDPKWGEIPMAVIVAHDPADPPTDDEIETHCRAHLAAYKRPRRVVVVESLPRNANGKVLKTELRRRYGALDSYDAGPVDTPLLDETIGANFERTALTYPNVEALVDVTGGRRWTYAELNAEIDCLARALMATGIQRGDRVGIWSPNCPEWTILQYATAKVGAILVSVNPAYRTHELSYVLARFGHSAVGVCDDLQDLRLPPNDRGGTFQRARDWIDVVFLGADDWKRLRQRADAGDL